MRTMTNYIRPYLLRMGYGFVIKFFGTIMDLLLPWILAYVIDDVIPLKNIQMIFVWGAIMIVCSILALWANIFANRKASGVARDFTRDVRHDLYVKVTDLSSKQLDQLTIPSLVSRLTTDTYNMHQMVGMIQRLGVRAPILILGGVVITMTLEPVLCMILVATLPFIGLTVYLVSRKGVPMFSSLQRYIDQLVKVVRENVTGIRVIKALSKIDYEKKRFEKTNQTVVDQETKANYTMALINPIMNILLNVGLVFIIIVGAQRVNAGISEPGKIVAFLSYFTIILTAMMNVTRLFIIYSKASASADRIEEVLLKTKDLQVKELPVLTSDYFIEFNHVNFSFNQKELVLEDIDFHLKKNQSLGIIGATGAGKSTIIQLLMRFYDVSSGSILINGKNIQSIDEKTLREMFGVTFQNDTIFSDSVSENIRFGRALNDEQISLAAQNGMASEFIENLSEQYDTHLEAKGANLSGGQKQRILISRALAGHPKILILDDASSALDYKTDALLRQAIVKNYPETTLIMIAQRVSSIMQLDHILVLEEGKILAQGNHASLMQHCDIYRELAVSQMGGQIYEV
ncbi:ABC transporter ATP-binding protein [Beduini massiliensis]|uniref:ABC transporter ATP-binding protein n=1 Tax=Beduini massiliensis TaxID=1585974 RepID=UPI00059A8F28|nr:ABC transporter ATP-binding protein [Beduini massiliensis]